MLNNGIYVGLNMVNPNNADSDLVNLSMIIGDTSYYFEFNDCDLGSVACTNMSILDSLLFIDSEPVMFYKNAEKNIIYKKDNVDNISDYILNLLGSTYNLISLNVFGDLTIDEFFRFRTMMEYAWDKKFKKTVNDLSVKESIILNYLPYETIKYVITYIAGNDVITNSIKEVENVIYDKDQNILITTSSVKKLTDLILDNDLRSRTA